LDPTFPARFDPCTPVMRITPAIMTASSTSSLSVSSSSPSVSASSSTDVLSTTSAVSLSIQTPNQLHSTSLKTSLAQTLSRLLPVNCTLTRFDYLRNQAKQMKKKNMTLPHPFQTELNHISAEVKQALIHKYEEMHSHTQRWKDTFIKQSGQIPTRSECPPEVSNTVHNINLVQKLLLHEWNITVQPPPIS